MTMRVSLAELAAADIQLRPAEAVAIVTELCRQNSSGQLRGIPSPGIIRLTRDGRVSAEGPMTTSDNLVARAAHLLNELLPAIGAPSDYRARGGLRLVIARALGTLDLPPYESLEEFCSALTRFAASDLALTARSLFRAWEQHCALREPRAVAPALTISDIRRARRATGLSLDDLSLASGIPAARLRELEWGYLRNWRADQDGREHVVRYARASGLDENVVMAIAWPMIEEAAGAPDETPSTALVRSAPQALTTFAPVARRRGWPAAASWGLAVVAAAVLALATFAIAVESAQEPAPVRTAAAPAPVAAAAADASPAVPLRVSAAVPAGLPAKNLKGAHAPRPVRSASSRPRAAAGAVRRGAPARPGEAAGRPGETPERSLLHRELFRIVIR